MRQSVYLLLFASFGILLLQACGLAPSPRYHTNPTFNASRNDHPIAKLKPVETGDLGVNNAPSVDARDAMDDGYALNSSVVARKLANTLVPYLDTPYKYGGETESGIDCSGLTMVVFRDAFDVEIPHKAEYQIELGSSVMKSQLMAGDLVFFYETKGRSIGHVGIFLGNNKFIHSMTKKGVVISKLTEGYWDKYYAGARRLLGERNLN